MVHRDHGRARPARLHLALHYREIPRVALRIKGLPDEVAQRLRDDPKGRAEWERATALYQRFVNETLDSAYLAPSIPW